MSEIVDPLEEFGKHLPSYLSESSRTDLFQEIKQFPENIDKRLYTSKLSGERDVFQGDGLRAMPIVALPDPKVSDASVMVISNTCDIDPANPRKFPVHVMYCPLLSYQKVMVLLQKENAKSAETFGMQVRKQRVSYMMFLPQNGALREDKIALLDRVNNCHPERIPLDDLGNQRLFTLSDYGFYLLLYKLSVHFTRIREGIERGEG